MTYEMDSFTVRQRLRRSFGTTVEIGELPNLLALQKGSYEQFLQSREEKANSPRDRVGIEDAFHSIFPVKDAANRAEIHYVNYWLEDAKYDVEECLQRGITYAAPLRVKLSLIIKTQDEDTEAIRIDTIKEQDVYMGDMPLMTERGTFIINGTERVIVSQTHRSPGVFFDRDVARGTATSTKPSFSVRVIPYRGSWLDFEFGARDTLNFRIDRKRKLPVTTLLMAMDSKATVKARAESQDKGEELDPTMVHGMGLEEILNEFYKSYTVERRGAYWAITSDTPRLIKLENAPCDILDASDTTKVLVAEQDSIPAEVKEILKNKQHESVMFSDSFVEGQCLAKDYIDERGLVLGQAGDEVTAELLTNLRDHSVMKLDLLDVEGQETGPYLLNILHQDKNRSRDEALADIYRVIRPGEPPTLESAELLFKQLFFSNERYDLSAVGRVKICERLGFPEPAEILPENRVLSKVDILAIIKELISIRDGRGDVDDIDHLGNRRIRSVGELLENLYRNGLMRMERTIRERMSVMDLTKVMPQDLINSKPVVTIIKEFFGSSQLSQFMDQTNPLAEVTHKRRLSALGPGGLSRDRAGFEVRDVHTTHYGRVCPIETPEGPNIGLINSLATYARVNRYGFIETPYRRVDNGVVTDEVTYMTATREENYLIAQANSKKDKETNRLIEDRVSCRHDGEFRLLRPEEVDYIDVSPKQIVSVAASLIPFLENDDANRALMGSNMQRQAVPLLRAEAPLVGTGMERRVALDSGVAVLSRRDGVVDQVDATHIVVRVDEEKDDDKSRIDIYNLLKFQRTNQNTCILQRPLPNVGDRVSAGDVIADGSSIDLGELALGRNVLVAFMSWNGYNFEDSIVISERLVQDDVFTSIHIEEYECVARDTKLGSEDITRDIPNVSEDNLRTLDESGIVYVGAEVKAGDILVGKVTPKGESPVTPEEKLLRAIFGEKATDVRDSSLYVPQGGNGTIVEVRVFTRQGVDKDERAVSIGRAEVERLAKDYEAERRILEGSLRVRLVPKLLGQKVVRSGDALDQGTKLTEHALKSLSTSQLRQIVVEDDDLNQEIDAINKALDRQLKDINNRFDDRVEKLRRGDELMPGVLKIVKVFIAVKHKLQCGDKMAGRHGNKGVVSRIVPIADMPFLEDGTPVDIILNPLGVPSRMNVGQILETHLGWACHELGRKVGKLMQEFSDHQPEVAKIRAELKDAYEFDSQGNPLDQLSDDDVITLAKNVSGGIPIATPVFDGANEEMINHLLEKAGLPSSGQTVLIDGLTGDFFDRPVTVGYIYMLKLHHLVEDKLHARSTGPYSLVTQQPLGGKAQFGGQRFGEMEVWALQAYGASYTLQEILTVKSDDITGRAKIYESIILNEDNFEAGIPESFNVLIKELRSLCLNVELLRGKAAG